MKTYIILLRGVMPTGKNKVPMAQLRQVLSNDGFGDVRTWIQSGNVVLRSDLSARELEERVHFLIKEQIGADLAVVVRTSEEIKQVLHNNPYKEGYDMSRLFFVSFAAVPSEEKVHELLALDLTPEKLSITKTAAYMYIPGTYGKGKLSNNFLEKKLGIAATMRNFNTMTKMVELGKEK